MNLLYENNKKTPKQDKGAYGKKKEGTLKKTAEPTFNFKCNIFPRKISLIMQFAVQLLNLKISITVL